MRHLFTLFIAVMSTAAVYGQSAPLVTIEQINTVIDLANCNDSSTYLGDTVRFRAHVITDGGLSEVSSGSVQGGNRPFIYMVDTAAQGAADSSNSIEVMGVYTDAGGNLQPVPGFTSLFQGDKVEVYGVVEQFDGNTQFTTIGANSVTLLATGDLQSSDFVPKVLSSVGVLNDNNRVNNVQTGEYWQNGYVELQNVTVVQVTPFSGNRVSFDVADANGNTINVSDRFLAQKTPSFQLVNPNTPSSSSTGSFVPPSVGTFYTSLKGIVRHSANGCTGGTGRGYEINPFDSAHYEVGASAPNITNLLNLPLVPTSSDTVTISVNVTDADGSLDTVDLYWSANTNVASGNFTAVAMTSTGNNTYEYDIPAQPNGTLVRYYVRAVDNDGSAVLAPASPSSVSNPNFEHYTVRDNGLKIFDLQYSGNGQGNSAFEGQTVQVSGYVTAARRDCDLEYVYLQDPDDSTYSGIALIPNQDLNQVYRGQKLIVEGTVQETFGVTYLNVSSYNGLADYQEISPVVVDPSDANLDLEAYEGMLISYQNPAFGQIEVINPNQGFGEYTIGVPGSGEERRVIAGRQDGTSANSSLYVSLVSDTSYNSNDGAMQVPPVAASQGMTMDAMTGILWYSFGTYKVMPRNNFDIVNLSTALDTTNCSVPNNIGLTENKVSGLSLYPNPAQEVLNLNLSDAQNGSVQVYSLNGQMVQSLTLNEKTNHYTLSVADLKAGVYLLQVNSEKINSTYKIVVTE